MPKLSDIPVRIDNPGFQANALPLLHEIRHALQELAGPSVVAAGASAPQDGAISEGSEREAGGESNDPRTVRG